MIKERIIKMKKSKKKINAAFVILLCANIFGMAG